VTVTTLTQDMMNDIGSHTTHTTPHDDEEQVVEEKETKATNTTPHDDEEQVVEEKETKATNNKIITRFRRLLGRLAPVRKQAEKGSMELRSSARRATRPDVIIGRR
jgi:hypothetical protein